MSDYLPKELMIDIFTRLPIKSILRCTCVCRSWYSLINSPNFISAHLNQSTDDYILIQPYSIVPKLEIYALSHKNENLDQDIQFDFPFDCSSCYFIIVGSCNGILCFATADMLRDWNNFYFWNPSIRKSVKLPVPGYTCGKFDTFGYTLGFGLDPVTNDNKVVLEVHTTHHPMRPHVDLYKLSTGVWEDISRVSLSYLFHATTL
ncbi:hypothetical protein P3L10_021529 [Capsicum annuum]